METLLQFELSEQYHICLHWLCTIAVTSWMPSAVLKSQGWGWPVLDSKWISLSPYPSRRILRFTWERHAFGCHPFEMEPKVQGSLSNFPSHFCQTNIDRMRHFFCSSLSLYDLIATACDCSTDSCSGGDD